jgi:DNA-binding CsgD family transcriptional regulator
MSAATSPTVDLNVPLLLTVLDGLNHGLILATPEGRSLFVNHSARGLLSARDGIALRQGRLIGMSRRDTDRLHSGLRDVISGRVVRSCVQLSRLDGRRPILASISATQRSDPGRVMQRVATIVLRDCDAEAAIDADALAEAYRLTRRESDVAALVASGTDPLGAARALEVGVGTVRNHLKRVFDKMGVSKQSQLASRAYAIAGGPK